MAPQRGPQPTRSGRAWGLFSLAKRWLTGAVLGAGLAGCAGPAMDSAGAAQDGDTVLAQAWAGGGATPWQSQHFPGKSASEYRYGHVDSRAVVQASADGSASMLRRKLHVAPGDLGRIRFSWKVPALIGNANLAVRETDDAPVRIVLAFEGDRSRFSGRDAALSEMSRLLTGEEMPYATLMYVWCNTNAAGQVVMNPRTERIRTLVVESGPANLNQWLAYERDIRADFEKAFGEPPGALVGIALMTDADNTQSQTRAWYGPVSLAPPDAASTGPQPVSR